MRSAGEEPGRHEPVRVKPLEGTTVTARLRRTTRSAWARIGAPIAILTIGMASCRAPEEREGFAALAEYENRTYGYAVQYPEHLDLREYTDRYTAVGRASDEAFDAALELVVEPGEGVGFAEFAADRARQACAADGPDTSLLCTELVAREPFTSAGGVPGEVFHFRHETTRPGEAEPISVSERGPIYAFDWSAHVHEGSVGVLFVRPPMVLPPEQVDSALVRQAATSLRRLP